MNYIKVEHTSTKTFEDLFDPDLYKDSCVGCEWLTSVGSIDNPTHFECKGDMCQPKRIIHTYESCQLWCKYTSKWVGMTDSNQY